MVRKLTTLAIAALVIVGVTAPALSASADGAIVPDKHAWVINDTASKHYPYQTIRSRDVTSVKQTVKVGSYVRAGVGWTSPTGTGKYLHLKDSLQYLVHGKWRGIREKETSHGFLVPAKAAGHRLRIVLRAYIKGLPHGMKIAVAGTARR